MELNKLSLTEALKGLEQKKFSSVELTEACLNRIEKRNKIINAFITIEKEQALQQAAEADAKREKGEKGKILGIPFSVKDAICTQDIRSTASAKILDNYVPPFDATVIASLKREGGIIVGKTNCDAFGHGASNENSMYGPVRNPHDENKVAGGSSGGSAASVADHQCIFSIGEDTGGSIRQPASLCGIVGLRPSYGRNSRYGIMPMASSLDTVGPMTKTVEDTALLLEIMAGKDQRDATTVDVPVPEYTKEISEDIRSLTVGVPKEYFDIEGMDVETRELVEKKIEALEKQGVKCKEVSLPHTKYSIPVYYIVVPAEDSSNLGRMDGIRYGVQESGNELYEVYANSRAKGFPAEVKRRIMIGTYALSAGYFDAYYKKAQKVRTLIIKDFEEAFQDVDVLLTPTSPFPAFDIGAKSSDPLAMYLADIFVSPSAVAGVPALSVPIGNTKAGLPVGMQVIGPRLKEEVVLRMGYGIERGL